MKAISFFLCIILSSAMTSVDCLKCEMSFAGQTTSMDCNDKTFGEFQNKCTVSIIANGTDVMKTGGCLPKATNAAACGQSVNINGMSTKICCCDTDNCNDKTFINKCEGGTSPTSSPAGFECIMKASAGSVQVSGKMECSNKLMGDNLDVCAVFINATGSNPLYNHMCLPKIAGTQACDSETMVEGSKMKVCCCNSAQCNDDAFAKECLNKDVSPATNVILGTVVFVISMMVSMVTVLLA